MRFTHLGVAALAVAALSLTACASGDTGSSGDSTDSGSSSAAFPVTVSTDFGDVTVEKKPTRIVALGWGDAETALALGVQPVGASDWLAFGGEGVGPWAEGLYDEAPEIIGTLEPSFEAIAALKPDLILDTKSSGDKDRYEKLSSIATTIGVPEGKGSYLTSMDEQMELVSTALGLTEKGDALLADVDTSYDEAAAAHPEWKGKTIAAATKTSEGWGAYIEGSERVAFLERLGFAQSPAIADLPANSGGFSVDISSEQLDLLDADLIVAFPIFIPTEELTGDPLFQAVPAVAAGRSVVIDGDLSAAYSLGSTLAVEYAIENLVPQIASALE
jgi:iron complex transport system substrate-binding protein